MSLADPALFDQLSAQPSPAATDGATASVPRAFVELAVVAPTYNERGNIIELLNRLRSGLAGVRWEVIVVDDDSPDGTADLARTFGRTDPRVRVIRRVGRRGLSSACIEGMLSSNAEYVAVIDADLQHDPALLALMLRAIREQSADIVVASRYVDGGSLGDWAQGRSRLSRWATRLTRRISGVPVSDPMSGYFLMRREVIDERARALSGRGFKILLDILTSNDRALKVVETPFTFGVREHGESKLSLRVMVDGLTLLFGRALSRNLPRRLVAFAGVGATGVGVQFLALSLLMAWSGLPFAWAQAIATLTAMASNYAMNNRLTFGEAQRKGLAWLSGLVRFAAVCGVGVGLNVAIAQAFVSSGWDWRLAAITGIGVAAVWNFTASLFFVWTRTEGEPP